MSNIHLLENEYATYFATCIGTTFCEGTSEFYSIIDYGVNNNTNCEVTGITGTPGVGRC